MLNSKNGMRNFYTWVLIPTTQMASGLVWVAGMVVEKALCVGEGSGLKLIYL